MENELEIVREYMQQEPVNVPAILSHLEVEYSEQPILSGESGWISLEDGNFKVVVNSQESPQRKRFTAAHELAHYLMHRDILKSGRMNRHTDRLFGQHQSLNREAPFKKLHEVQANKLAAQIIMPASRIREFWIQTPDEDNKIQTVANQFGVSRRAMEIRLKTLGLND